MKSAKAPKRVSRKLAACLNCALLKSTDPSKCVDRKSTASSKLTVTSRSQSIPMRESVKCELVILKGRDHLQSRLLLFDWLSVMEASQNNVSVDGSCCCADDRMVQTVSVFAKTGAARDETKQTRPPLRRLIRSVLILPI